MVQAKRDTAVMAYVTNHSNADTMSSPPRRRLVDFVRLAGLDLGETRSVTFVLGPGILPRGQLDMALLKLEISLGGAEGSACDDRRQALRHDFEVSAEARQ